MMSLRTALILGVVFLLPPGPNAQARNPRADDMHVVEIPYFGLQYTPYQVVTASTDGSTLRIGFSKLMRSTELSLMEGHCLLAIKANAGDVARTLVPAEILEVDTPETARIKVAKAATELLQPQVTLGLIRPPGITTAEFKSLPGVIRIGGFGEDRARAEGVMDPVQAARMAGYKNQTMNNLKLLGLALHNYESANGQFPPTVIYGPDGKPWHSWRVLILPYIEEAKLFAQYDFREPWDSPKNLKVLEQMPKVFRDPVHGETKGSDTHYAALVGTWVDRNRTLRTVLQPSSVRPGPADPSRGDILKDPKGSGIGKITDGTSFSLMVTSVSPDRKIPWTKPEDIEIDQKPVAIGQPAGIAAPYPLGDDLNGPKQAPFLFADGSARFISDRVNGETLRALLSRDGGEVIDLDSLGGTRINTNFAPTIKVKLTIDGPRSRATVQ